MIVRFKGFEGDCEGSIWPSFPKSRTATAMSASLGCSWCILDEYLLVVFDLIGLGGSTRDCGGSTKDRGEATLTWTGPREMNQKSRDG